MGCKATFIEGARTYRQTQHQQNASIYQIRIKPFKNRDPAGPEHHWVARKQVQLCCNELIELSRIL